MPSEDVTELLAKLLVASLAEEAKRGRKLADRLVVAKLKNDPADFLKVGDKCLEDSRVALTVIGGLMEIASDLFRAGQLETDGDKLASRFQEWNESAKVAKDDGA